MHAVIAVSLKDFFFVVCYDRDLQDQQEKEDLVETKEDL